MFCSKCGSQLPEDAKFCSNCGVTVVSTVQPAEASVPSNSSRPFTQKANEAASDYTAIDINTLICHSPYYIEEFSKIEKGQPSKFNWVAFFFAPYLLLYRRMAKHKMFSKLFICMIVMVLAGLFTSLLLVNSLFTVFGALLGLVSGVLMLIISIQCGKKFNMEYYKHLTTMMEKIKEPVALKKAVLPGWRYPIVFGVVYVVVSIIVQTLGGVITLGSFVVGVDEAIEGGESSKAPTKQANTEIYYTESVASNSPVQQSNLDYILDLSEIIGNKTIITDIESIIGEKLPRTEVIDEAEMMSCGSIYAHLDNCKFYYSPITDFNPSETVETIIYEEISDYDDAYSHILIDGHRLYELKRDTVIETINKPYMEYSDGNEVGYTFILSMEDQMGLCASLNYSGDTLSGIGVSIEFIQPTAEILQPTSEEQSAPEDYDDESIADNPWLPDEETPFSRLKIKENTFQILFHQSYLDENSISVNCSSNRKKIISKIENVLKEKPYFVSINDGGLFGKDYLGVTQWNTLLYYGKIKDNRPDGFGVLTGIVIGFETPYECLIYAGEFKEGRHDGYGVEFLVTGLNGGIESADPIEAKSYVSYDGEWKDNDRSGKGNEFIFDDKSGEFKGVIVTNFKKGLWDGKTKQYNENGVLLFEGNMKKGCRDGKGTTYFENGKKYYDGEFKDDLYHGKGKLYTRDGDLIYSGKWEDGDYAS